MQKGRDGDGVSHSGDDPEVTAITRRLDRTGDTLGAIGALEQLLIDRTGQIPVISPELLAAHSARLEQGRSWQSEADDAQAPLATEWRLTEVPALDPAPGFSPWVDPAAIAAAIDAAPREVTDVSTKVFAVFSAERTTAPVLEPQASSEPEELADVTRPAPAAQTVTTRDRDAEPAPSPLAAVAPDAPAMDARDPDAAEEQPLARRRRFWPFGRR